MPMTAEEKHEYRTAFLATLRRIADALDSIAGILAEASRECDCTPCPDEEGNR